MPLHYTGDGYTFSADAQGLTIEPGPKPCLAWLTCLPLSDVRIQLIVLIRHKLSFARAWNSQVPHR